MKKRVLSLLLCLIMALSLIPTAAFADDGNTSTADAKTTNGAYTNGNWDATNNGGRITTNDGLTLSKTATYLSENTYRIDLSVVTTQTTTTTTTSAAAATVLVIDTSGSMAWCTKNHRHIDSCKGEECTPDNTPEHWGTTHHGFSYHKHYDENGQRISCIYDHGKYYKVSCETTEHSHDRATGGYWCGNSALDSATDSRIAKAKAAAQAFLDSYKDTTAARWIAIVSFANSAASSDWFDVSTTDGYNSALAAINGLGASGATNLNAGLKAAQSLMASASITAVPEANRNVIALTDGTPTKADSYGNGSSGSPDINSTTTNTATDLKKKINSLYTICFAASGEVCYKNGPTVEQFLSDIASDGKNYTVNDGNQLPTTFVGISTTITSGLTGEGGWTVTDPMAANISVTGDLPTGFKQTDATKNIYTWTLSTPTVSENGDTKTYTYTTSYTVTIDPTELEEDTFYPTNKVTTLNYKDANGTSKTADFPVPGVKVKLPAPATGTLVITKNVEGDADVFNTRFGFTVTNTQTGEETTAYITGAGSTTVENLTPGKYTVKETNANVPGYDCATTIKVGDNGTANRGDTATVQVAAGQTAEITVTNTYTQITQSFTVTKVWKDFDNALETRPDSVTINLLANGNVYETKVLNKENNWQCTFTNIPATDRNGSPILCSVEEVSVPGYTTNIKMEPETNSFTVTNSLKHIEAEDETILPTLTIKKVDKDTQQPLEGAVFDLKQTSKLNSDTIYEVTTDADGLCQIANLVVADAPTYELTEFTAPVGYQKLDTTWKVTITGSPNVTYKVVTDDDGNITGYKEVRQFSIESVADKTDPTKKLTQDSTGAYVIENEKLKDVTVKDLKVTKEVTLARESITPGTAKFIFKASYLDPMSDEYKLVNFADNTLTITTTGKETKTEAWKLVVPAAAFDEDGDAFIVVEEVNGGLTNWKYDKTQYGLAVNQAGEIMFAWKVSANNASEHIPISDPLKFSNEYDYTYVPPTPRPTPKPTTIKSVKTGDMGIAMYAMTSLLSLGGAALVIKKRKDEE